MARYANEEIEPHARELLQSMLRSIRQETTEHEAVKALKGMLHNRSSYITANML
jgi:hypothetical protein